MASRFSFTLFFMLASVISNGQSDFERVKQRVIEEVQQQAVNDEEVTKIAGNMRQDGTWQGIDYEDVSRTGFQHVIHLDNMVAMSLAFQTEESMYFRDPEISRAINKALDFWCKNDFTGVGWHDNQIKTPTALVTILLLMDGHIRTGLKNQALAIIDRANLEAGGARPGGDRIKIGGIAARRALVMDDPALFGEIMKAINDEIQFSTGNRGMQHDFSFHHRANRVNNTVSYGTGYAMAFAEWAFLVQGTEYAFEEEKTRMLVDYYLDGICKHYIYGIYTDWGAMNRSVSRGHSFTPHDTRIVENLLQVTDYRAQELIEIIRLRKGDAAPTASFCKFFWQTEHFVCQRPGFYTSVRMFSIRNRTMEHPHRSEGLKNHHKADGANFLSLRGDEYLGIWPVMDYQKIPGATILQKDSLPPPEEITKDGFTYFVGAVTDGLYGAACFDFISPLDPVKARKSWFFFENEYVCLGAGIESYSPFHVVTTLNQCLLNGRVIVEDDQGRRVLPEGAHVLKNIHWVHHDHVGYLFPEPTEIHLSNEAERGSWWDISKRWMTPRETIEKKIFKMWIDHGPRPEGRVGGLHFRPTTPKDVTYQYIVVPSVDAGEMQPDRPGIEILHNNRNLQAVRHHELGLVQLICYRAGSTEIADGMVLTMDSPGAIMLHMEEDAIAAVTVADPSRLLDRLHFRISGEIRTESTGRLQIQYDPAGDVSHFIFRLPSGHYAGQSMHIEL